MAISRFNTADDYAPYVFKTSDFGKSWTNLSGALPDDLPTYSVREDPQQRGLLYLGTDKGVMVSMDDGGTWQSLRLNMPYVPINAMTVKDNDLVIATNGRGFWVLDDLTPLREASAGTIGSPAHLFDVQDHTRFGYSWWMNYAPGGDPGGMKKYFVQNMRPGHTYYELGVVNGEKQRKFVDAGDPRPLGVLMYFRLTEGVEDVSISILDGNGAEIITYGKDQLTLKYAKPGETASDSGLNRFVWDMRYPLPPTIPTRPPTPIQPIAKPGMYTARLTVDGVSQDREFELKINPHEPYTREQTDARMVFWLDLYENVLTSTDNVLKALQLREDTAARIQAMKDGAASADDIAAAEEQAAIISEAVGTYEATFVPTARTLAEIINLPAKIFTKMIWLHNMMEVTEGPVSEPMRDVYRRMNEERDAANAAFHETVTAALAKLHALDS